jgi:HSP20 family protein
MHPFAALRREVNDLFDQAWRGFDLAPFGEARRDEGVISPNIDVRKSDNEFKITAELPGMD